MNRVEEAAEMLVIHLAIDYCLFIVCNNKRIEFDPLENVQNEELYCDQRY